MYLSLGPIVRLMTRGLFTDIQSHPEWDEFYYPTRGSVIEAKFWLANIDEKNGYAIKPNPVTSQIIFTDASNHGYGGYLLQRLGKVICQGKFESHQQATSSTERELLAIQNCLVSFAQLIRHEAVNIRTDNFAASRILEIGSPKPHLQKIAIQIFEVCVKNDVKISPSRIPRDSNQIADYYSKIVDTDDWSVDNGTFQKICKEFGHPSVDRFADNLNAKVTQFNSKFHCPGSSAVNAFTQDWADASLNWLCPPIKHISSINHLRICQARGILIIPQWPSSHFWPIIHSGLSFEHYIKKYLILRPYFTTQCNHSIFNGFVDFNTLALLIDFS